MPAPKVRYFDVGRHWTKRIAPHLADPVVSAVLVRDFHKYTWGRSRKKFEPGMVPFDFESCDWWVEHRGPRPKFWDYVTHAACHWLVNFNLRLAERAAPARPWRILTSDDHSTVFDGDRTLFDLNFLALGVPPGEAYRLANVTALAPGRELRVYQAAHWSTEVRR